MQNNLFSGSICLTELVDQAKKGHSAFTKAQNGKVYFNMLTWHNDTPDKYDNVMSHQLSSVKEKRESEGKVYVGNSKVLQSVNKPVTGNEFGDTNFDNVPVREEKKKEATDSATDDQLPF